MRLDSEYDNYRTDADKINILKAIVLELHADYLRASVGIADISHEADDHEADKISPFDVLHEEECERIRERAEKAHKLADAYRMHWKEAVEKMWKARRKASGLK